MCGSLLLVRKAPNAARTCGLDKIGWTERTPLVKVPVPFGEVFPFPPRPLQQAVIEALGALERPAVLLVEAPMGEGKTEAAFYADLELQRRFGHRGCTWRCTHEGDWQRHVRADTRLPAQSARAAHPSTCNSCMAAAC